LIVYESGELRRDEGIMLLFLTWVLPKLFGRGREEHKHLYEFWDREFLIEQQPHLDFGCHIPGQ
jgi:hypothetical protein